jgi:hypothetical protein
MFMRTREYQWIVQFVQFGSVIRARRNRQCFRRAKTIRQRHHRPRRMNRENRNDVRQKNNRRDDH